jgi:peroxiredoxin
MPASAASPLAAKPLPDFQRRTLRGETIDTKAMRGRVVVVKFFAKYCEPCKRTLPAMQKLSRDRADVAFVGVAEDERASDVQEVVDSYGLSFPIVHDQGNVLSGRYRVTDMPVTFVADRQGVVRWVGGPGQSEDDLARAVAAAAE